ncbi:ATP-binding protein [Alkalimonas sp. MEB108]|uniref:ATP-binding protein n=1 Tax=Alkalimonas cellulosilytica TaxID=3058395 RepID=A0ABU7JBJ3_9GAMM|nr:ATP-binding protein [Alkalimonas sp. MEB108]MEE2003367.1 ATP-binding protein [Alkalimonas sp. MEB108]
MPVKPKQVSRVEKPTSDLANELQVPSMVKHWVFRILLSMNGVQKMLAGRRGYLPDSVAEALNIDSEQIEMSSVAKARVLLKEEFRKFAQSTPIAMPPVIARNMEAIAKVSGFNATEQAVFTFIVLVQTNAALREVLEAFGELHSYQLAYLIADALNLPVSSVQEALSSDGRIQTSGLVRIASRGIECFHHHFSFASCYLPQRMTTPLKEPMDLLRDLIKPAATAELTEKSYHHLGHSVPMLKKYLKQALAHQLKGVNILLYGPPGTGKTELSKVMAKAVNASLFEVSCSDEDGDPVDGEKRFFLAKAAQLFLASGNNLLLFDEIEDVFQQHSFLPSKHKNKAWINEFLETNQVPTFWLSNHIGQIDPAYIRRFDMVIEIPVPPAKQRAAILQQASHGLLNKAEALALTQHQQLSPGVITRASKVVRLLGSGSLDTAKQQFRQLTEATLKAQGCKVEKGASSVCSALYDPALTQADCDLTQLTQGLQQAGTGRLCLYGPPGTGKTAFGHYLAKTMGKELLVKRGSDLISCWVGATEKAIAEAFAEATANNSILLMDEVDSFLQERSRARNSWEITGVNEMLTQMEAFEGIFIASTNLMHNLDKAALRRFDLKACFGYLRPQQIAPLFRRYSKKMGLTQCKIALDKATKLSKLTPGDFAAIARRQRFAPMQHARELTQALLAECELKDDEVSRPIGFVTTQ